MSTRFGLTKYRLIAGLGLLASGGVAGAVTTVMVTDDPAGVSAAPVTETATASARTPLSLDGPLACSIYDIPAPVSAVVAPRSTLLDGVPYVIVCDDSADQEVLSEAFIQRLGG